MAVKELDRYFIAIIPPSPIYEQAQEWKEYFKHEYHSKGALNAPPHLTLHMPFLWSPSKESILKERLEKFFSSQDPVNVRLNGFGSFNKQVIYIHVEPDNELRNMQSNLHGFSKQNLNLFNADYKDRPFHPHITLAFRDLRKQHFLRAWEEFQQRKYQAEFLSTQVNLLRHNGKFWETNSQFSLLAH